MAPVRTVVEEVAALIRAGAMFYPADRAKAIRMARQAVVISEQTGMRSPERCRALLERLDVAATLNVV